VAHDLHVDPERLHPLARRAAGLLDGFVPLPELDPGTRAALAGTPRGAALLAEIDRIVDEVTASGRTVAELAAVLTVVAAATERGDAAAAGEFRRIAEGL
jgi:hypothetical protein